jgi:DNA-binding beta-propeller fold protein YncE
MKRFAPIFLVLLAASLISKPLFGQPAASPVIAFEGDIKPVKLPPDTHFGEVAGVAVNSKGHIFVYHRGGMGTKLLEFKADGSFLRYIGNDVYGFSFAHVVKIDKNDNIWCVDEGANMIIEFDPSGEVLLVLGRKPESVEAPAAGELARPARQEWFNRPTDVGWDPAGNIYVADGYGNSRVAKFDKDGNFIKAWGQRGSAPGEFHLPHSLVVDDSGKVYVGDRENKRIQVFDGDGTFLTQFINVGAPWAICLTRGPNQVLFSSDSDATGRIYKLDLKGNILGSFGAKGKQRGQFGWVHEMACPSENEMYVGELLNWRVQKLTLKATR